MPFIANDENGLEINAEDLDFNDYKKIKTLNQVLYCPCGNPVCYVRKTTKTTKENNTFDTCPHFRHINKNVEETEKCKSLKIKEFENNHIEFWRNVFKDEYISKYYNHKYYYVVKNEKKCVMVFNKPFKNIKTVEDNFNEVIWIYNTFLNDDRIFIYNITFYEGDFYINIKERILFSNFTKKSRIFLDYDGLYLIEILINEECIKQNLKHTGFKCKFHNIFNFLKTDLNEFINDTPIHRKKFDVNYVLKEKKENCLTINIETLISNNINYNELGRTKRIYEDTCNWYVDRCYNSIDRLNKLVFDYEYKINKISYEFPDIVTKYDFIVNEDLIKNIAEYDNFKKQIKYTYIPYYILICDNYYVENNHLYFIKNKKFITDYKSNINLLDNTYHNLDRIIKIYNNCLEFNIIINTYKVFIEFLETNLGMLRDNLIKIYYDKVSINEIYNYYDVNKFINKNSKKIDDLIEDIEKLYYIINDNL